MNRSTELSAPVDFFRPVDRQEKFQFFFKKFVVIVQVISKEGKTLNKGTPSGHDFSSSVRNEIYGCKLLIDPNRLFGTQHRDCAGQFYILCNRCCSRQNGGWRRN